MAKQKEKVYLKSFNGVASTRKIEKGEHTNG
jgi:hypothetical protein